MFYSHDILTSRKYGVATVWQVAQLVLWLVATLGSRSILKRVSRKAILDVNVRKACETILAPAAPFALRLQSNLLYGVVLVYSQQCGYVLHDAESARNNMRTIFNAIEAAGLDPEGAHRARPEQLTLPNDPNFLPDFDRIPILEDYAIAPAVESQQSLLLPQSPQTFTTSPQDIGGIMIPPPQSSSVGRIGSQNRAEQFEPVNRSASVLFLEDDLGLIIEPDRAFQPIQPSPSRSLFRTAVAEASQMAIGKPGKDTLEQQDRGQTADNVLLPKDYDAYSITAVDTVPGPTGNDYTIPAQEEATSATVEAPLRRQQRVRKAVPMDIVTQLHNGDFARWNTDYISDMANALHIKQTNKLAGLAKKNAQFWVLGPVDDPVHSRPLDIFSGVYLLEAFSGLALRPGGQKRRFEHDHKESDSRRVRPRNDTMPENEVGRGMPENYSNVPMDDDDTVEQGRNAPTPLDDRLLSSILPWNQSAGSRRNLLSSGSRTGGRQQLSMLGRRGSRLTSASPLLDRGNGVEMEDIQFQEPAIPSTDDDFELFPPADTQVSTQSQWLRAATDMEGANFLAFVQSGIDNADMARQQTASQEEYGTEGSTQGVEFEELLPPGENSVIIAAQAIMHVLTLGTKSLLRVHQSEDFGPIVLSMQ